MLGTVHSIVETMQRWVAELGDLVVDAGCPDDMLLSLIESAERLTDACAAVQARATHEFSERCLGGLTPGSPADLKARRDLGGRIGRARRVSPFHGGRYLELSRMLVRDLPRTLEALAAGQTNEYRASLVANAAACLGSTDRAALDADLGPRLTGKGNGAVRGEADRIAAGLDAAAVVERHRRAVAGRRVTTRPAPDAMVYLTALLPVADGVAAWAALDRHATQSRATGDPRSRGQIMADELTQRLLYGVPTLLPHSGDATPTAPPTGCGAPNSTQVLGRADPDGADTAAGPDGQAVPPVPSMPAGRIPSAGTVTSIATDGQTALPTVDGTGQPDDADPTDQRPVGRPSGASSRPGAPPVRQIDLILVMTDRALLDGADTPAIIPGHGPIPAALARGLLADADPATRVFLRRLYTDPTGKHLLSADARGRLFPDAVRQFILARDQRCRTPFCDAPIRQIDHVVPHAFGGPTTLTNTSGLCTRCNLTKASRRDRDVQPGPPPPPPRSAPWAVDHGRDHTTVGSR